MNHVPYSVDVPDSSVQRPEVPSSVAIQGKTIRSRVQFTFKYIYQEDESETCFVSEVNILFAPKACVSMMFQGICESLLTSG